MKAETLLTTLRKTVIARFRAINFRLWGNIRLGFYKEYNLDDVLVLINEWGKPSTPTHTTAPLPTITPTTFRAGSNYAILSRLCEQYYVYEGSDKLQKKIINEVNEIIEELRQDTTALADFEEMLNALHNNIMSDFRQTYPALKEKDYQLYAYMVAGFSATTISVLLNKEKSVIYNRISRLRRNIKDSNTQAGDRFINILP